MSGFKSKVRFLPTTNTTNKYSMDLEDLQITIKERKRDNKLMKLLGLHGPLQDEDIMKLWGNQIKGLNYKNPNNNFTINKVYD